MNRCCTLVCVWGAALCSFFFIDRVCAQSSVFTYQGHLLGSNGLAVTGNFDFQFQLLNASSNQVGQTLTNAPVAVSNGLFTTTLDFGGAALDGTARFLQIGVRTNGSTNTYSNLSPTQPLTAAPYAFRAGVATSFPGAIGDAQLSANVPLLNGNPVFTGHVTLNNGTGTFSGTLSGTFNGAASGTFSGTSSGTFNGTANGTINGNGAGLTNVNITNVVGIVPGNPNWQVVQSTSQQAASDTSYLTTNTAQVTLTLPASPAVGDTLRVSGAGAGGWKIAQNGGQTILTGSLGLPAGPSWSSRASTQPWQSVAVSADGTRMVAAVNNGFIFTSADSGATWNQRASSQPWSSVASSADGKRLLASINGGSNYVSIDMGTTWVQRASSQPWVSVASSVDGAKLVGAVNNGNIWTSVDSGTTWVSRASSQPWVGVASSADGAKLVGVVNNGFIFTSIDSGSNWVQRASSLPWVSVASSADGTRLVAVANGDKVYVSGDSGVNWLPRLGTQAWQACGCSGDGTRMAAVVNGGQIYTSFDSGQTWTPRDATRVWQCIAFSADSTRAVAAEKGGLIYVSPSTTSVGTAGYLLGIQYSAIELQYIGNGQWMPLSFSGSFSAN
jgi:hypothetical protein